MRLVADAGSWSTGPQVAPIPVVAVLEVSGAVLAWPVDVPSESVHITLTEVAAADWLWRVLGEAGHVAVAAAVADRDPVGQQTVELPGVDPAPQSLAPLRRLAMGHWLRRWWPASSRDAIAALDPALLDGELAVLTAAAQDYFTDDTLDSEVGELLAPHRAALRAHAGSGDPRVAALARRSAELADEAGIGWTDTPQSLADAPDARRDDYALAAGAGTARSPADAMAGGVASVNWIAVPPGVFDAAEQTVDWAVAMSGPAAVAIVRVATTAPADGIAVRLRSGAVGGTGVLDAAGRATLALVDADRRPVTETQAWNHDWAATTVAVGADVPDSAEAVRLRRRVRDVARARLARPGGDAFLAEILAAESDY